MHLLFVWEKVRIVEPELSTCSVNLDVFSLGFKLRSLLNYAPSQQPWDIFPLGFSVNTNVCMNLNVHARVSFGSKSHCHFCKGLKQAIFHIDLLFSLYFVSLGIRFRLLHRFNQLPYLTEIQHCAKIMYHSLFLLILQCSNLIKHVYAYMKIWYIWRKTELIQF